MYLFHKISQKTLKFKDLLLTRLHFSGYQCQKVADIHIYQDKLILIVQISLLIILYVAAFSRLPQFKNVDNNKGYVHMKTKIWFDFVARSQNNYKLSKSKLLSTTICLVD